MTHAALLLALALQGPHHAALHPADAELFLAVPDVPALLASYEETAAVRILREERVQALLTQAGAEVEADPRAALAGLLGTWLPGDGGAELVDALRAVSVSKVSHDGEGMGVLVIVDLATSEDAERCRSLLLSSLGEAVALESGADGAFGASGASGLRLHVAPERPAWIATSGSRLVLGAGSATLDRYAEHAAGRVDAGETLAGSKLLARARAAFREGGGTTVFWLLEDHPPLSSSLASGMLDGMPAIPPRLLAAIDPFTGAHVVRMRLEGGRFVTEMLTTGQDGGAHGVRPIDPHWLDVVPDGTMFLYSTAIDGSRLARGMSQLTASLAQANPEVAGTDGSRVAALSTALDAVCTRLGPGLVAYAFPLTGLGLPQTFLWIDLAEPDSFASTVDEIVAQAEQAVPGLSARTRDYRVKTASGERVAVPVTTITLPEDALALGPMLSIAPSFAVVEDRLLVGLSSMHVKRELKRLLGAEADEPEARAGGALAAHGFALPEDARTVLVMDWGAQIDAALELFRSLAAVFGDDLPFDPASLPEAAEITRHLRPTFHVSRRLDDATLTYHEASFGPEIWASLAAGLLTPALAAHDEPSGESSGSRDD